MGRETTMAKCPYCEQSMASVGTTLSMGPSWMFVDGPGSLHGNVVVLICPNAHCQKVLGSYYELVKMPTS